MSYRLTHSLSVKDIANVRDAVARSLTPAWTGWVLALLGLIVGAGLVFIAVEVGIERLALSPPTLVLIGIMTSGLVYVGFGKLSGALHALPFRRLPDRRSENWSVEVDAAGLRLTHDHGVQTYDWSGALAWVAVPQAVMVLFTTEAVYLPRASFASAAEMHSFLGDIERWTPDDVVGRDRLELRRS
jgi:hypothetical protein